MIDMTEVRTAWIEGNNAGEGFVVPDEHAGSVEDAATYLARNGGRVIEIAREDDGISLVMTAAGDLIGIGDASGPWCIRLPKYIATPRDQRGEGGA